MAPADQAGAEACPLAFMQIGKTTEEDFCNDQAQNRVPQKLQLLIILFAAGSLCLTAFESLLICQRTMGQRLHQQLLLAEGVTQRCLERVGSWLCHSNLGCLSLTLLHSESDRRPITLLR